ncbi:Alpha/Beta hydrolase protein [Nemania sp. FL0916]|nr:Alpha/Beta hydrolase protein [Nemania sp. FL0916]
MLDNPSLIYEGPLNPWLDKQPAPLVLLHDGGGTTFSYHCLYPIGRTVYGIHNARLDEGGYWETGISGMAAHYVKLIESVLPAGGEILLGGELLLHSDAGGHSKISHNLLNHAELMLFEGWSLGGHLSIEVAWQLANPPADSNRPKFKVLGMIFLDSVCPTRIFEIRNMPDTTAKPIVKSPEELKEMPLREKVDLNMTHARMMIARWKMPDWKGRETEIPPTVLMRAKEYVQDEGQTFVDYARDLQLLGWDEYHDACWIKEVVELDGHHFNIFEEVYLRDVTMKIAAAADQLDKLDY